MGYDYEKMNCLKQKRENLYTQMWKEKDNLKKRVLQFKIKILDIKMAIIKLKN